MWWLSHISFSKEDLMVSYILQILKTSSKIPPISISLSQKIQIFLLYHFFSPNSPKMPRVKHTANRSSSVKAFEEETSSSSSDKACPPSPKVSPKSSKIKIEKVPIKRSTRTLSSVGTGSSKNEKGKVIRIDLSDIEDTEETHFTSPPKKSKGIVISDKKKLQRKEKLIKEFQRKKGRKRKN